MNANVYLNGKLLFKDLVPFFVDEDNNTRGHVRVVDTPDTVREGTQLEIRIPSPNPESGQVFVGIVDITHHDPRADGHAISTRIVVVTVQGVAEEEGKS